MTLINLIIYFFLNNECGHLNGLPCVGTKINLLKLNFYEIESRYVSNVGISEGISFFIF